MKLSEVENKEAARSKQSLISLGPLCLFANHLKAAIYFFMVNNDVIRSLRYIFDFSDQKIADIIALAGLKVPVTQVIAFLKNDEDPNYMACDDETMAHFLDGLIYFKRGKDETRPPLPFEFPIDNNVVLKKLRVALTLKEEDMHELLSRSEYPVGRAEMTAFLRKRGHPNYRECGDQVLRYFLKGLKLRHRPD